MLQEKNPIHLMLVDDNPADIALIKSLLETVESVKYCVQDFSSINAAIDYIQSPEQRIDICLVDYSLGMETALDFIKKVDQVKDIILPIVVMTGQPNDETDHQLMMLGVQDYWDKGALSSEMLERSLRYAIHQHQNYQNKSNESEQKTRHLAQISHDLKNPLGAILSFVHIIEKIVATTEFPPKEQSKLDACFSNIFKSGDYMNQLIHELLNLSEIESGNTILKREQCDLRAILKDLSESFNPLAEAHGLELVLECESNLLIYADDNRLRQIISNLLSNAIKYTDEGSVTLRAKKESSGEQTLFIIEVQDTGIGIDPAQHSHIFTEYTKVHKTLKKHVESTGLGLSIVKQLVELHNGSIIIDSELDKGSKFTIQLPQRSH